MALTFEAPAKDSFIKVTALNVAFYHSPSTSAERAYKPASKQNTYTAWAVGDTVKSLGNVIQNNEGTWLEAETLRWYRKNFLSGWFPVLLTVYYRVEDQTCTWISNSVVGGKPNPAVGGTTGTGSGDGSTPAPQQQQDNTLQKVGIGIALISLLNSFRK